MFPFYLSRSLVFRCFQGVYRGNVRLERVNILTVNHSNLTHSVPMHTFSNPRKHQKTVRFSDVFRRQRKEELGTNGLR